MSELEQGIAAARAGRRAEARELLLRAVQADERSEQAWLWLAGVMDDPEDMRVCLENVLELNPANPRAQQGLKWIEERYGPRPAAPVSAPAPSPPPAQAPSPPVQTVSTPAQATPAAPVGLSSTHTTMNLDAHLAGHARPGEAPAPSVSLSAAADGAPRQLLQASALPPVTLPCPYCGATTELADSRCPRCRRSLMTRVGIPEKRSASTTVLAVLWAISALLTLLGTLGAIASLRSASTALRPTGVYSGPYSAGIVVFLVAICFFQFAVTYGLWVRMRWAYIAQVIVTALGFIINIVQLVVTATSMGLLLASLSSRTPGLGAAGGISAGMIVCMLILALIPVALTVSSYGDFFGQKARIDTEVGPAADPRINYNNGLAYKNKGMWYLAAREWEASLAKAPADVASLHALALAYAQLKQFDQARTTIQRAINVAPDNSALQDSRALIDQLAMQGAAARA